MKAKETMERIVLEKQGRKGIVLEADGTFRRVRLPRNAEVGDALPAPVWAGQSLAFTRDSLHALHRPGLRWKRALAASTAVVVLLASAGVAVYATPASYVSLDLNMGVSLTLNTFDRIISVHGDDALASSVLEQAGILHMSYEDGIAALVQAAGDQGALGSGIQAVVAVASEDGGKGAEIGAAIRDYLDEELGHRGFEHQVEADNVAVATVREARTLGITPGRLRLLNKLRAAMGDAYVQSEWIGKPIQDIMKQLQSLGVDPGDEDGPEATDHPESSLSPKPTESGDSEANDPTRAALPSLSPKPTESGERQGWNEPTHAPSPTPKMGEDMHGDPTPAPTGTGYGEHD